MRRFRPHLRRRPVIGVISIVFGIVLVISPALSAPPSGAVGHWSFDEGGGPIAGDSSGNGFDGTIIGAVHTPGVSHHALDFTGNTNEMVVITDPVSGALDPGTGDLSLSLWMRTPFTPGAGPPAESWELAEKRDAAGDGYELYIWDNLGGGTLSWQIWDEGMSWNVSVAAPNDGGWHHVAGVLDGADMTLYVDGLSVGTTTTTRTDIDAASDLVFGSDSTGATWSDYEGDIDEVLVYPRALTPEEIDDLASATAIVNSSGDIDDALAGDGVCDTGATIPSGAVECTLRAALSEANASALLDTIEFDLPTTDPGHDPGTSSWAIQPATPLPAVTAQVHIDGSTQTGWAAPTTASPAAIDGSISLELRGNNIAGTGLDFRASAVDSVVRGIAIGGWPIAGVAVDADGVRLHHLQVGTRADGLTPDPNGTGIVLRGGGAVVGGTLPADRVVVAGNSSSGIDVASAGTENMIAGSMIGVGRDGETIVPNGNHGIIVTDTTSTRIGTYPDGVNTIAGHTISEVDIISANDTLVHANRLGISPTGAALGGTTGVRLLSGAANNGVWRAVIAHMSDDGVYIDGIDSKANRVARSEIFDIGGTPIDLESGGPTINDPGDIDDGPNDLQNYPEITSASAIGGLLTITFDLDSIADTYRIDVYKNPSQTSEAEVFEAARNVDLSGTGSAQLSVPGVVGDAIVLTATARVNDELTSTSELSPMVIATAGTCVDTDLDGLCDFEEDENADADNDPATNPGPDTDGDGTPDYLDPVNTVGFDCGVDQAVISQLECGALVRLYESTAGANWTTSTNWMTSSPDQWHGVTVDGGVVTRVELDDNGLVGPLPAELTNLTQLTHLDVGRNAIDGAYPPFASMPGLIELDLSANSFDPSPFDPDLLALTSLERLELHGLSIISPIPSELGDLTSLRILDLGDNDLTGPIPAELDQLVALEVFDLGDNDLDAGPIPSWIDDRTSLRVLDLERTNRVGSLTSVFGELAGLTDLRLAGNDLGGRVPEGLDSSASLVELSLEQNRCLVAGTSALATFLDAATPGWDAACIDTDGDGLWDSAEDLNPDADFDPATTPSPDSDGDGSANAFDANDDDDAVGTAGETADPNNDGSPVDARDVDRDGEADYLDLATTPASTPIVDERRIAGDTGDLASAPQLGDMFGSDVTPIGDLDGDGTIDLAVGAPGADDGAIDRGRVHILLMRPDGSVRAQSTIGSAELDTPLPSQSNFGAAIVRAGDLNDDGTIELLVGAPGHSDGGPDRGAIFVLSLRPDGSLAEDVRLSSTTSGLPIDDGDRFGSAIDIAADADGNGLPEAIVGAPGGDDGGTDRGAIFVLDIHHDGRLNAATRFGSGNGLNVGLDDDDQFGSAIAVVGDLDGDGDPELAIGAPGADDGGIDRGAIHIVELNGGSLSAVETLSETSGGLSTGLADDLRFGTALGAVGDVNRDGTVDLLVGVPAADANGVDRGGVMLISLDPSGSSAGEQIIASGFGGLVDPLDDGDRFGAGIAGIGDLDGDGTIGMAVGASRDSDAVADGGAIWILDLDVASTVVVNSTTDQSDLAPGDGLCSTGQTIAGGAIECTLRAALEEANATQAVDTIEFEIPTTDLGYRTPGYWRIRPGSPLPSTNDTIAIVGDSQSGSTCATDGIHTLTVLINGADTTGPILQIGGANSEISGLALMGSDSAALVVTGDDTVARCNWVGFRPDLVNSAPTNFGIDVSGDRVVVGGTSAIDTNTIAVDGTTGIRTLGAATDVVISNNRVGTDPSGTIRTDVQTYGISITGSSARTLVEENLISGNRQHGIIVGTLSAIGPTIQANIVGPALDGTTAIRNGGQGIRVQSTALITIGGTDPAAGNTIAYNNGDGVNVQAGASTAIIGNSIFSNNALGIDIGVNGVTPNAVGDGVVDHPEIISAEASGGVARLVVQIHGEAGDRRIDGHITLTPDPSGHGEGRFPLSSTVIGHDGGTEEIVLVFPANPGDRITLTATTLDGNGDPISTSEFSNVYQTTARTTALVNSTSDLPDLTPGDDRCDTGGTNAAGLPECSLRAALDETNDTNSSLDRVEFAIPTNDPGYDVNTGVFTIASTANLRASGTTAIDGTTQDGFRPNTNPELASFNGQPVILIDGTSQPSLPMLSVSSPTEVSGLIFANGPAQAISITAGGSGSTVTSSWFGLDGTGRNAQPIVWNSILASGDDITIGGSDPINRNVFGDAGGSIRMQGGSGHLIRGNLVNTDIDGLVAFSQISGIQVESVTASSIDANVVFATGNHGVRVADSAGVVVSDNRIGVGTDGRSTAGTSPALVVERSQKVAVDGNLISGNDADAITIESSIASVYANDIGVDAFGDPAPNSGHGVVLIDSPDSQIGGLAPGSANTIRYNDGDGVSIDGGGAVVGNAIANNGGLAIDWDDDGVTANDPGDTDGVPNHPVLETLNLSGTLVTAEFSLDAPAGTYRIEFFDNSSTDPTGHGEAERFVTSVNVVHSGAGSEDFVAVFSADPGDLLSATATGLDDFGRTGDTSELSPTERTNQAPTFDLLVTGQADPEGGPVTLGLPATDLDGDTLAWTATGLPPGLAIDPTTGTISGTVSPTAGVQPSYSTVVTVSDGFRGSDIQSWLWVITDVNRPPVIDPIPSKVIDELTTVTFTATASDPDLPANTVSFSAPSLPPGATLDPGTGLFEWTPTEEHGPGSFTVTIVATDNGSPTLSDSTTFTIDVTEVNEIPQLDPIGDQLSGEGSTVSISPIVTDVDIPTNTLEWTATGLPPGLAIDSVTGEISGTIANTAGAASPYTVVVSVTDGVGGVQETIAWTITDTNQNPTIDPIEPQLVDEGGLVRFVVIDRDPDLPPNELTLSATGIPDGATFDPATGVFEWQTDEVDGPSTTIVTITSTDDGVPSLSATRPVTIEVAEVNADPTLDPISDTPVNEFETVTISPSFVDIDLPANTMTFSATGLPDTATLDTSTGEIVWTPDEATAPSVHEVALTISDEALGSSTQNFILEALEVNDPPTIAFVPDVTVNEFDTVSLLLQAVDPDLPANTLTFAASGLPEGAAVDPETGALEWTPTEADGPGAYTVTATVTDDAGAVASTSFVVTVNEINVDPVIESETEVTVRENDDVSLFFIARDIDVPADTLSWTATGLPPGLEIDPSTGIVTGRLPFTASDDSPYAVELTVSDGRGGTDTITVELKVEDQNRAPSITPVARQTINEGTSLRLPVIAVDPDGDLLSYSLSGQPGGAQIDAVTGQIRWTPAETQGPASYTFDVVVRDVRSDAITVTSTVRITVREVNQSPVLAAVPDGRASVDTDFTVGLAASDPDRPRNTLQYRLVDFPEGATINPSTGLVRWTPDEAHGGRTLDFTVEVTDNGSPALSSRQSFSVFVDPVVLAFVNPVATGDSYVVQFGESRVLSVLANDDGDALRIVRVTQPSGGRVEITSNQRALTFRPSEGFTGESSFTYVIENADGGRSSAQVIVFVGNPTLVANDDRFRTIENVAAEFDVLENDEFNTDGISLSVGRAINGTVSVLANDLVRYVPDDDFVGSDRFVYTIADAFGSERSAQVSIEVSGEVLTEQAIDLLEVDTPEPQEPIIAEADDESISAAPIQIGEITSGFAGAVSSLEIPPELAVGAGLWLILFGVIITWFLPGGAVMVMTNVAAGQQVLVHTRRGEPDRPFEIRHDADMIWTSGRPRRRRGRRFRKIETPGGPGYVDESHLTEMNEAYLDSTD